jgi:hypothetical protein
LLQEFKAILSHFNVQADEPFLYNQHSLFLALKAFNGYLTLSKLQKACLLVSSSLSLSRFPSIRSDVWLNGARRL